MDVQDLRYAVATLDEGSFARAATRLYVSRQAVSQSVKRLEGELGTRLFTVRDGNRLVPTPESEVLLGEARGLVDSFDAFLARHGVAAPASARPQSLVIAMATGASISLPPDFLANARAAFPAMALEVEETNTDNALELIDAGQADLALVGSHPRYLGRYEALLVVPTGLWLAVPNESPLSSQESLSLADLDGQTIVTAGRLNHLHRYLLAECEEAGVQPSIPVTASNIDLLIQLALEYRGMFFAFPPSILPFREERDVTVLPLETPEARQFGTYLVRQRDGKPSPAARRFWDYVAEKTSP